MNTSKNLSSNNASKGFTLVELLVVMSVIFLLASVTLVLGDSARVSARNSQRNALVQQYKVALDLAFDANNTFPSSGGDGNWVCLGGVQAGHCWFGSYTPSASVNAALAPFIPNTVTPPLLGLPYDGITYAQVGSAPISDYEIDWMLEGINQSCSIGTVTVTGNAGGNTWCHYQRSLDH